MLTWDWRTFNELTTQELYDLLALRQEVFTVEQKCIFNDIDFKDQQALHLLGRQDRKLVAYLRLFLPGVIYPDAACFGRILTAAAARGLGLGRKIMDEMLLYLAQHNNTAPIIISAQQYLEKFYQEYGFITRGKPYDEDGIPHLEMIKPSPHGQT